ncbi:hypothetical protein QE152_g30643 [Popillia japonica]|uniref:Uncharacterized protein n=1 Tax=Popillia japonica TaxID=7064 RepID=A0AAW1JDU6_POPJA
MHFDQEHERGHFGTTSPQVKLWDYGWIMAISSKSVGIGESNFEQTLMKWYEEVESEVSDIDEVSECDVAGEHDTISEFDAPKDDESDDEVAKNLISFVIFSRLFHFRDTQF